MKFIHEKMNRSPFADIVTQVEMSMTAGNVSVYRKDGEVIAVVVTHPWGPRTIYAVYWNRVKNIHRLLLCQYGQVNIILVSQNTLNSHWNALQKKIANSGQIVVEEKYKHVCGWRWG